MIITALTWAALLLTSALALGCAIAIIMMVIGIVCNIGKGREKRDAEMCVIFAIFVILLTAMGTGFVFAAIALGRNLLL